MKVSCSLGDLDTLLRIQLSECGMGEDCGGNFWNLSNILKPCVLLGEQNGSTFTHIRST